MGELIPASQVGEWVVLGRWLHVGKGTDVKSSEPSSNSWVLTTWRVMENLFSDSSNKYLLATYYMNGTLSTIYSHKLCP